MIQYGNIISVPSLCCDSLYNIIIRCSLQILKKKLSYLVFTTLIYDNFYYHPTTTVLLRDHLQIRHNSVSLRCVKRTRDTLKLYPKKRNEMHYSDLKIRKFLLKHSSNKQTNYNHKQYCCLFSSGWLSYQEVNLLCEKNKTPHEYFLKKQCTCN